MNWRPAGPRAALIECSSQEQVAALYAAARAQADEGIEERVPAARSLLLIGARAQALAQQLCAGRLTEIAAPDQPLIEIPLRYDGEDLDSVAQLTGLSRAELIAAHSGADWRVAFCGFAPGFAYLTGGPEILQVPRRREPRKRVPKGAVAVAGEFTGIYPRESPGGWQLLGHTDVSLWDLQRQPPALLQPGARVRFVVQGS